MSDLISRADAIEAVAQQWLFEASAESPYVNDDDIGEYRKLAEELFEDIPSADAVQGEWIKRGTKIKCSNCKSAWSTSFDTIIVGMKYCPMCGARMENKE